MRRNILDRTLALTAGALLTLTPWASGAVLVSYQFTGNSAAPTTTDANVTGGSVSAGDATFMTFRAAGSGVILGGNPAPGVGTTWGNVTNRNTTGGASTGNFFGENFTATENDSVTNNDYYQFSITPNVSQKLNLTSFKFDIAIGTTGSTNGVAMFLRSDAGGDNFTTTLGRGGTTANSFSTITVSLPAPTFSNLTTTTTFRLYVYDRASSSNTNTSSAYAGFYLDNLTVNGTTALIPEPASLALLGLAGLLMLPRRAKKV